MNRRAISWTSLAAALCAFGAVTALPATSSAEDAALLMVKAEGQVNETAMTAFVTAAEATLAAGQTPSLMGLVDAEKRLAQVAPEALQCDEATCLKRAGQALTLDVGYTVAIREEFESYTIDVVAWDLTSGNLLARRQESCDICTSEEAADSLVVAAKDVTSGWTVPGGGGAVATVDPTPDPKPRPTTNDGARNVNVAVYADPMDATIRVDGSEVGKGKYVGSMPPGVHTITVERSGYTTSEKTITLDEGDGAFHLAIDLRSTDDTTVVSRGRTGGLIDETDQEILAWSFTAGGAILTIGGAVLLGIDGEGTCEGGDLATCPEVFETTAGGAVMLGLGVASLTAGITLFLWDDLAGEKSDSSAPGPSERDVRAGLGVGFGLSRDQNDDVDGGVVVFGGKF